MLLTRREARSLDLRRARPGGRPRRRIDAFVGFRGLYFLDLLLAEYRRLNRLIVGRIQRSLFLGKHGNRGLKRIDTPLVDALFDHGGDGTLTNLGGPIL